MGFWKVLGGVAAGVGAVVALPVFGPVGAVTAVGAAIGAAVGGTAGVIASSIDDDKITDARARGREEGKAEVALKMEKLKNDLNFAAERMKSYRKLEDFLIALFAVGISVANCDGIIHQKEKEAIDDFIAGLSATKLPEETRRLIEKLYQSPPSFSTAMEYVKKIDRAEWGVIDDVITLVMKVDGEESQPEQDYLSAWIKYKAS